MNKAYSCAYCRRELTPIMTTTNTNGNLGRQYVLCTAWPQGEFRPGTMSHQRHLEVGPLGLDVRFFSQLCKQYIIFELFSYVNEIKEPNN